jgi:hypothetical protein
MTKINPSNSNNTTIRKNTLSSSIQNFNNNNQTNLNIKSNNFLKPTQSTSNKDIFRSSN